MIDTILDNLEHQCVSVYILEFLCRKDKLKELLVLCCFNFQLIKFPTIISDSIGCKRRELFALMEDSF